MRQPPRKCRPRGPLPWWWAALATLAPLACHSGDLTAITSLTSDASGVQDARRTDTSETVACLEPSHCLPGEVCSLAEPACVVPSCGLPPSTGGAVPLAGDCDETVPCATGLTCVPRVHRLGAAPPYAVTAGRCFPACDPCRQDCPPTTSCVALGEGGGFCSAPLVAENGGCDSQTCAAGLTCYTPPSTIGGIQPATCLRYCVPEPRVPAVLGSFASADCLVGEVCLARTLSIDEADLYVCVSGEIAETGALCGSSRYCLYPDVCGLTCTPPDCEANCPASAGCFAVPAPIDVAIQCIRDGALPFGSPCADDRNCATGLTCQAAEDASSGMRCR